MTACIAKLFMLIMNIIKLNQKEITKIAGGIEETYDQSITCILYSKKMERLAFFHFPAYTIPIEDTEQLGKHIPEDGFTLRENNPGSYFNCCTNCA